ncbi:UNVERIFIED_CONTAM: hypothetical protein Slati_2465600 [Sesamum latifolium]|uniref:Uncharacterized protein n=1 Tax=Sesamum latifolium TaxID=2727402 RepID=A0AAW2WIM4_9LAMI
MPSPSPNLCGASPCNEVILAQQTKELNSVSLPSWTSEVGPSKITAPMDLPTLTFTSRPSSPNEGTNRSNWSPVSSPSCGKGPLSPRPSSESPLLVSTTEQRVSSRRCLQEEDLQADSEGMAVSSGGQLGLLLRGSQSDTQVLCYNRTMISLQSNSTRVRCHLSILLGLPHF